MPTEISWCGQTSLLLKYWKFFPPSTFLLYLKVQDISDIRKLIAKGIQAKSFPVRIVFGCIYSKRLRKSGQNSLKNFLRVPSGLKSWAQTLNKSQLMKMNQVEMVIPCIDARWWWGLWGGSCACDATQHQPALWTDQESAGEGKQWGLRHDEP